MLLAIDIGNTNIVIGVFDGKTLKQHWRLSSSITRTSDESWLVVNALLQQNNLSFTEMDGAIIASVVPNLTPVFTRMFHEHSAIKPIIVDSDLDIGLKILYHDPKAVGADRLVDAVAGFELLGGPTVIVDFGTATTFNVITKDYEYLGGIICLGVETSATVLHRYAARLPKVELKFPPELIGRTTETSIQSGLMYGTVELVDGLIRRLQENFAEPLKTIATGGLANLIVPHLKTISRLEPFLTLDGLRIIYERVSQQIPINKF
jgi:type III pantothenate kinase